jgi:serine/threonine-protein kinase
VEDQVYGHRYRVIEKIGSGGMADVYKAVDEVLGRTVAVKVLHPRYASDPTFVARFRQEAQAAANLSNPHIVNIYDWGQEDSTYFIIMEFVRGTDLKSLIDEKGPVDPIKAAEYAAQACSALAVAHSYDVIHRDIKPHNIVLTPDGQIKVMDFGIARAGNTTMTQTGSVLGTAQYISPEQAQGRPLGPPSDLYSLGVVLYEMTTGRLPFQADTPVAVALKQVNEPPRPPRELNPAIPPSLETVILRAMAKDPAARYDSAEEMRDALRRVVAGQTVSTVPHHMDQTSVLPVIEASQPAARLVPQPQRRRPVWPWVVALLLLLAIGIGAALASGLIPTGPLFGPAQVAVPDVTGIPLARAESEITSAGLKVGPVGRQSSGTVTSGTVISQQPSAGLKMDKGGAVRLVVSSGPETVDVPDLNAMTDQTAIQAIQAANLRVGTIARAYNKAPSGTVYGQSPKAGTKVAVRSVVNINVSLGIQLVTVPDVSGRSESDAKKTLTDDGFNVTTTHIYSTTTNSGLVIDTNPSAGSSVAKGSTVKLRISKGPELVSVPDVVGVNEDAAKAKLADFTVTATDSLNTAPSPDRIGTVEGQSLPAGSSVPKGSAITITIYRQ